MDIPKGYRKLIKGEVIEKNDKWLDEHSGGLENVSIYLFGVKYCSLYILLRKIKSEDIPNCTICNRNDSMIKHSDGNYYCHHTHRISDGSI